MPFEQAGVEYPERIGSIADWPVRLAWGLAWRGTPRLPASCGLRQRCRAVAFDAVNDCVDLDGQKTGQKTGFLRLTIQKSGYFGRVVRFDGYGVG